jgi:1-acyl-sn-glycerol-3-phosphate acyltransferase
MLPPRLVRRLVLAPLAVVIALALAVLFPLLAIVTTVFGWVMRRKPRRTRAVRLLVFVLAWAFGETAVLFMCLGTWIASGFGGRLRTEPFQTRHYAVMQWFLDAVYRAAVRSFGLRIEVDEPPLTEHELTARLARPVIVLSRHAGPGDSFLLVRQLLSVYRRRPRVVMKATLQLDPCLDVVVNRLPNVFISRSRAGERHYTEQIERLAGGLDEVGALVIFPEGGNWRLEQLGRRDLASRARQMPNLLAPRGGGAFAAIMACPDADVIFVAHAGLDRLVSPADIWRHLDLGQVIRAKWWRVPVGEVPRDASREAQLQWLYQWWERMDAWITQNRPDQDRPLALAGEES